MIFLYQYIIASFFMFCFDIMAGGNCWPPFSIVWLYHSGATCLLLSARHRSSSTHQNLGTLDRNSRPRNKNGSSQSQRKYTNQQSEFFPLDIQCLGVSSFPWILMTGMEALTCPFVLMYLCLKAFKSWICISAQHQTFIQIYFTKFKNVRAFRFCVCD